MSSGSFFLFIIFMVLKLTGSITWSWWWVCFPLYVGLLFFFVITLLGVTGLGLYSLFTWKKK